MRNKLDKPTLMSVNSLTQNKHTHSEARLSCLMHGLLHSPKNQENLKALSYINVYLLNANSSEYMTEKNNQ